jgi:acetyl-CoA carboxylase biotin carboxyl carrier protein
MDRQLIKALIDALEASELTELEYSRDGETLRLVKGGRAPGSALAGSAMPPPLSATPAPRAPIAEPDQASNLIVAPLHGIVHLERTPGAAPLVTAGQAVAVGQVLCTIEAMKVFTDVHVDRPGTVAEILVANADEVEAGQPLVRIE